MSDDYQYRDGPSGPMRSPRVWLTEGGAPYTVACASQSQADLNANCGPSPNRRQRVLLFEMGKQRSAIAYMIRAIAKRPAIKRLYYFNFHSTPRRQCGGGENADGLFCDPFERGLIGTRDDPELRRLAPDTFPVRAVGSGASDYSEENHRRPLVWSFHAWSDVHRYQVRRDRGRDDAPIIKHFRSLFSL